MGWVQDIVPNHMAMTGENRLLMDVLENSACSDYFDFFDIEWNHPDESMRGRLLAPFLGRLYGEALEDGEIGLTFGPEGFCINYGGLELPVRIDSYLQIIAPRNRSLEGQSRRRPSGSHQILRHLPFPEQSLFDRQVRRTK